MIKINDKAPNFSFINMEGKVVQLSDFIGKKVVVYFYPKDDTPGCTKEACEFRDAYDDFMDAGAVIIGVSPNGAKSHDKFRNKYDLQFFLASDEDHSISEAYGCWGEKKMMGKTYMGIIRSTYIVNRDGIITKIFSKVSPEGHSKEVLEAINQA